MRFGSIFALVALSCLACDAGSGEGEGAQAQPSAEAKSAEPEAEPPLSPFVAYQRKAMR